MVKKLILTIALCSLGLAGVYEDNCVDCHKELPVKIDKFFYRYLLEYSSESALKQALKEYLKNPSRQKTILPEGLLNRFGIKEKTTLSEKELQQAVDTYWQKYKVFGKLK